MSQWLLTSIEVGLNRLIPLDPIGEQRIIALNGKSISFAITGPTLEGTLHFNEGRVTVSEGFNPKADARVQGSAQQLLKLNLNSSANPVGSGVRLSGDASAVTTFQTFIRSLNIDFEEPLSHLLGDIAAQQVGQAARSLFSLVKRTSSTLHNTSEQFLNEELTLTVRPDMMAEHLNAIDTLYADTERLTARIARLQQKLNNTTRP